MQLTILEAITKHLPHGYSLGIEQIKFSHSDQSDMPIEDWDDDWTIVYIEYNPNIYPFQEFVKEIHKVFESRFGTDHLDTEYGACFPDYNKTTSGNLISRSEIRNQ